MIEPNTSLTYTNSDSVQCEVEGCTMTVDSVTGRYWLWSERLSQNLAIRAKSREDCLLEAIDSLLFTIQLRDERIAELRRITDLAEQFAEQIRTEED